MLQIPEEVQQAIEATRTLPDPLSLAEVEALDLPDTQWILGTLLPYPGLIAVSGPPESFKTYFTLWMAIRAASGKPLFEDASVEVGKMDGMKIVPTLFIEEENTMRMIKSRVCTFKRADCKDIYFYVDCGFKMSEQPWREKVLKVIEERGIKMVVIDPFSSVMGLEDENSNAEVSKVMDIIRKEFLLRDITVVFLHHPAKGDSSGKNLRGAGDILGKVDIHLTLEPEDRKQKIIKVSYAKVRVMDRSLLNDFKVQLIGSKQDGNFEFVYLGESKPKGQEEKEETIKAIEGVFEDGNSYSRKDVALQIGAPNTGQKFRKAWDELLESGKLKKVGKDLFRHANAE